MFEKLTPGQEIESTIVQISGDTIFIDLNAKSEGVIPTAYEPDDLSYPQSCIPTGGYCMPFPIPCLIQ